jgi:hypothetical protein
MSTSDPHAERERIALRVNAVKSGAAEFSQLLAADALGGKDWERAVLVLARCRAERKRLDTRLQSVDATVRLMWDCEL